MTAIAYRSGILAGDTLSVIDDITFHAPKITKSRGYLLGAAGVSTPSLDDLVRWYFLAEGKPSRPEFKGHDFGLIAITPKGQVQHWTHYGHYEPIRNRFWAIGSGASACLAAMELGATAAEAVRAAIKWQKDCGGRVTVRKLK